MRTLTATIAFALGAFMIAPSSALGQCSGNCDVGAFGQGGVSSGGSAQGFHHVGPGNAAGSTATNSGNSAAGRLVIDRFGNVVGTLSGTCHDDSLRGAGTGIFGDWEGIFEEPVDC